MKILLVDDNEMNLKVAGIMLKTAGHEVVYASNGREAVEKAGKELPELILLDIQLPDIEGTAICRILRTDAATAHIPIIALTSYAMTGDRDRFICCGFADYVSKPIDMEEFLNTVRKYVPK